MHHSLPFTFMFVYTYLLNYFYPPPPTKHTQAHAHHPRRYSSQICPCVSTLFKLLKISKITSNSFLQEHDTFTVLTLSPSEMPLSSRPFLTLKPKGKHLSALAASYSNKYKNMWAMSVITAVFN